MLKGIPSILSPELMKIMMEMGHGDEIVLADGIIRLQVIQAGSSTVTDMVWLTSCKLYWRSFHSIRMSHIPSY